MPLWVILTCVAALGVSLFSLKKLAPPRRVVIDDTDDFYTGV